MQKVLPYEISTIETYQCDAFILGIIQSYKRTKNVYINKFINLQCEKNLNMKQVNIRYVHSLWGDLWKEGVAELNLFHFSNFNKTAFVNFLKERIDQDNYLLFYKVDEYYLSYSDSYKKKHYIHDTYIYGYEDDYFNVVAYSGNKLEKLKIHKREIANCVLRSACVKTDDFCSFRINQAARVEIDYKFILQSLEDYYYEKTSYDDIMHEYGMSIWNVMIDCLDFLIKKNQYEKEDIDLRLFRMIWEHKKIMCDRIRLLSQYVFFDEKILRELIEIAQHAYTAFQLIFKYTVDKKHSFALLLKVKKIYEELLSKEKELYPEVISIYKKRVDWL